jgi:carbamoyltransferase
MLILGLNAYHGDSAACLMKDGCLVAAAEEERFRRIKHWAGLPTQAIDYCLREGGVSLGEVEHIAINRKPGVNNWRRLRFVLSRRLDPRLVWQKIQNMRSAASAAESLEQAYGFKLNAQVHHIEHHLAHLASAYALSGFEEAACISVDGFGDFASTAMGWGSGNKITIEQRIYFPHSLGIFYSAITQFIGFPHYGDEYKVMGLAPYGEPVYLAEMRQLVRVQPDGTFKLNLDYFRHHTDNVSYSWKDCAPEVGLLYTKRLAELLGPPRQPGEPLEQRHKDLARSAQAIYEETFFSLLRAVHARNPSDNLALAGGCAMNSVANGKVYLQTPFKKMYLPAAAGDAGGAIGAAAIVAAKLKVEIKQVAPLPNEQRNKESADGGSRIADRNGSEEISQPNEQRPCRPHFNVSKPEPAAATLRPSTSDFRLPTSPFSPYLGPHFSDQECWDLLAPRREEMTEAGCQLSEIGDHHTLCHRTAEAIADGKVVGWFQGRMEWGPRALGNRSILCDPRRPDMKEVLNAKIKRRESFRPFAPSILREQVADWFEQDDDVPYMMEVFQIRQEKRALIPAVCHADGSGRLQTVHREINPLFHQLISAFCSLTSVPLVLNTSFNENEPVVCRPEEALACFLRTKMDVLVLGSFFVERKESGAKKTMQEIGGKEPAGLDDENTSAIPAEAYAISHRLRRGMGVEEIYLFGSHARGDANADSDLDLLAIVAHSSVSRYRRAVEALTHTRDVRRPKDIIVMTRAEWERDLEVVCSLASTVKREGILLRE